jgi:hypothetical protein
MSYSLPTVGMVLVEFDPTASDSAGTASASAVPRLLASVANALPFDPAKSRQLQRNYKGGTTKVPHHLV